MIVGARCAGAATAMLLARRGLAYSCSSGPGRGRIPCRPTRSCAAGSSSCDGGACLTGSVGAGDPRTGPMAKHHRFHYRRRNRTVSVKPAAGVDALYAPRRTLLDRVLVDAAIEAGAEVRFGV